MTPSDDLFRLIRSLSKSEKGHFRRLAARHASGKSDYLRLFDAVDRMEEYDEERLRAALAGEAFLDRLPAVKHYLHRIIMKSLRVYNEESGIERMIRAEMTNAELLYDRGLQDQAWKAIARAKRKARQELKELALLSAIRLERVMLSNRGYHEDVSSLQLANQREEELLLEDMLNVLRYDRIGKRIVRAITRRGGIRNDREREEIDAIVDDPFLRDERNAISPKARFLRHHIWSSYRFAVGDFQECYVETRSMVELLQQEPGLWRGNPDRFLSAVSNLIGICQFVGRFQELEEWLEVLRRMPEPNEQFALDKFISIHSMELTHWLKLGRFDRALELEPAITAGMARFGQTMGRSFNYIFWYHLAWTCIGVGRYREALDWLRPILNDGDQGVRSDLSSFARILDLVAHFELGNRDLLPYAIRSAYRALYKRDRINGVESVILRSLRALADAGPDDDLHRIFARMRAELETLAVDPDERKAFDYFHFIPWLQSRMEGKLLCEMFPHSFEPADIAASGVPTPSVPATSVPATSVPATSVPATGAPAPGVAAQGAPAPDLPPSVGSATGRRTVRLPLGLPVGSVANGVAPRG